MSDSNGHEQPTFEGQPVLSTAIAVTNAGDGLSKSMPVDWIELHVGQRVTLTIDGVVAKVRFDPIKDTAGLQRVQLVKADLATVIDRRLVAKPLDAAAKRIADAKEIAGQSKIDDEEPEGDEE